MSVPLGVSPNGRIFLPSGSVASVTTKVHVPTSCCLIVWARARFDPAPSSRVAKITAVSFEIDFIRPPVIGKNAITNLAREIPAPRIPGNFRLWPKADLRPYTLEVCLGGEADSHSSANLGLLLTPLRSSRPRNDNVRKTQRAAPHEGGPCQNEKQPPVNLSRPEQETAKLCPQPPWGSGYDILAPSASAVRSEHRRADVHCAERQRAILSDAAGARDRRVFARRHAGSSRAPDRSVARKPARPAVHHREPAGRRWQYRRGSGRPI